VTQMQQQQQGLHEHSEIEKKCMSSGPVMPEFVAKNRTSCCLALQHIVCYTHRAPRVNTALGACGRPPPPPPHTPTPFIQTHPGGREGGGGGGGPPPRPRGGLRAKGWAKRLEISFQEILASKSHFRFFEIWSPQHKLKTGPLLLFGPRSEKKSRYLQKSERAIRLFEAVFLTI